jgi:MoaA/NifB/PqqE/SkfB family radical SAM enzyme
LRHARNDLKFREISLITNGTLLNNVVARSDSDKATPSLNRRLLRTEEHRPHNPAESRRGNDVLSFIDRLIISLDSLDPQTLNMVSVPDIYAQTVIANVREAAALQKKYNFKLILNAVITPETLPGMDTLIAFCSENNAQISLSPQSFNNMPRYELVTSPEYRSFIEKVIRLKKHGAPIVGSLSYFKTLIDQTPYECYPTLVPRIMPEGWLAYPCRPMEKAGGEQGGRAVNLLSVETWDDAWAIAKRKYGEAPTSCVSCFQQCYAEPSLMQAHPFEYLGERLRGNDVSAYAPG